MYFYLQQAARRSMWVEAYDCQVGWLDVVNENSNSLFLTIGPRRLLGSYCFSFTCNYIDLSKMCFRCTWFQINAGYKKKKKKKIVIVFLATVRDKVVLVIFGLGTPFIWSFSRLYTTCVFSYFIF